jgi:hypothetical protein
MARSNLVSGLRATQRLCKYLILASLVGYGLSWHYQGELPTSATISEVLLVDPQQTAPDLEQFEFEYRGTTYQVEPVAKYKIAGVIVSHNDISAWWDIYHTADSVDIKDLCLVWGENLEQERYKSVHFHNESVSCHLQYDEYSREFRKDQVSNNHLIADTESVRQKIGDARVGDQVALEGQLVNYCYKDLPESKRKSSLTRTDTAGGACEVMYVENFTFIKQAPRTWYRIGEVSRRVLQYSLIVYLLLFLSVPYLEYRFE